MDEQGTKIEATDDVKPVTDDAAKATEQEDGDEGDAPLIGGKATAKQEAATVDEDDDGDEADEPVKGKEAAKGEKGKADAEDGPSWAERAKLLAERITGEKTGKAFERVVGRLTRYTSEAEAFKGGLAAQERLREGAVLIPGKNASKEVVEAYRKAKGVPETVEGYKIERPEGYEPTTVDKEIEADILGTAHKLHMGNDEAREMVRLYYRVQQGLDKQMAERAAEIARVNEDDLRVEFGRDYRPTVDQINRYLAQEFGEDAPDMMGMRLADGTRLGDDKRFFRFFAARAKESVDEASMLSGETQEGTNIDDRIDELMKLQFADTKRYQSDAVQGELKQLLAVQEKRRKAG